MEVGSEDRDEEEDLTYDEQGYTHVQSLLYGEGVVSKQCTFSNYVPES